MDKRARKTENRLNPCFGGKEAHPIVLNVLEKQCVMHGVLLSEVAPDWLLDQMKPKWAKRYQSRFSDVREPWDEKPRRELAEEIGADGRYL